ncbi:MAG: RNA polymerase sigma-70 factor [Bacteroidales bacterium]|jgi:RNA polymerase sigma-70 factor (ECF subfamily)
MDPVFSKFNDIYSSYYHKSFVYVKSYVHDEMAAEDIVTDSLIQVWEEMKKRVVDPVAPFLFTVLKNRSIDYLRREKLKQKTHDIVREVLAREMDIRLLSLEVSDPKIIFSDEINEILEKTLVSLPEKTREIFITSRFLGKTYKEIAEELNISIKGVEYHIANALKTLRLSLKDYLALFLWLLVSHNH